MLGGLESILWLAALGLAAVAIWPATVTWRLARDVATRAHRRYPEILAHVPDPTLSSWKDGWMLQRKVDAFERCISADAELAPLKRRRDLAWRTAHGLLILAFVCGYAALTT